MFGWVLYGPISRSSDSPLRAVVQQVSGCESLEHELRKFWEIEEIPHRSLLTSDEKRCEEHFVRIHSRADDGRYIVRLPFKQEPPIDIGHSRARATALLSGLLRRYRHNPSLREEYGDFLKDYVTMGHMRLDPSAPVDDSQHVYIPHHPVIRADSVTSHLRVVFNASSPTSNGTSLNDHMLIGAKLQTDLSAVIMRWRRYRFVYAADIAKMYRQILVDPRDINYQKILWFDETWTKPQAYQLLTVTYGTASAPFVALRVLQQLVTDEGHAFPLAVTVLRDNIYVDDVLFGADDTESLRHLRTQVCALLRQGQFELRKWSSNASSLLADIPVTNHGLACSRNLQPDDNLKILGLTWNPHSDDFHFKVSMPESLPKTKREILSTIAKLFDPLGWTTPVTIRAKIFMQKLWQRKVDWDESILTNLLDQWRSIYESLTALNSVRVPRYIGLLSDTPQCELHGFADASTVAYAAAVYLKTTFSSGHTIISLLAGKSKVAPVKTLSVPRLELSAALLLAKLLDFVRSSLQLTSVPCICWTDSTVVLAWLSQCPSKWKMFVANRVSQIQTRYPSSQWRHVPTEDNPADCASRGLSTDQLQQHPLWWSGPSWLAGPPSGWPSRDPECPSTALEENNRTAAHISTAALPWDLTSRFSSWQKLVRVTAYILRFVHRARAQPSLVKNKVNSKGGDFFLLTSVECHQARTVLYRIIQREMFPMELDALMTDKPISRKSSLLSLNPFLDNDNIIRVSGRLSNAPLSFSRKHPIILASHTIVKLIVRHIHLTNCHSGLQLTLATTRQEYWILRSRSVIKQIIFQCVACTREKAATATQLMGNLPDFRVTPQHRAFVHCGIDYAGPVLVRSASGRGTHARKAYLAIFICMTTRAVHLELVDGNATPAFLGAFTRFCARRGLPSAMYSDNGTTFVGADRELSASFHESLKNSDFQSKTASDSIAWHFIPPSAPHFGGLWEAGVRSVKHHLRRVLGSHTLSFEELTTLLCQIEACLNSRPLAPLSDSSEEFDVLTPGHFLIGAALNIPPEPSLFEQNPNRLSR